MRVGHAGVGYPDNALAYSRDILATEGDWDETFSVNAKGTFLCYKYAGRQMIAQGRGGRIIGACSVSGKRGIYITTPRWATRFESF